MMFLGTLEIRVEVRTYLEMLSAILLIFTTNIGLSLYMRFERIAKRNTYLTSSKIIMLLLNLVISI